MYIWGACLLSFCVHYSHHLLLWIPYNEIWSNVHHCCWGNFPLAQFICASQYLWSQSHNTAPLEEELWGNLGYLSAVVERKNPIHIQQEIIGQVHMKFFTSVFILTYYLTKCMRSKVKGHGIKLGTHVALQTVRLLQPCRDTRKLYSKLSHNFF